jgi:benzoyl-CoA-dihydrodiol lyase
MTKTNLQELERKKFDFQHSPGKYRHLKLEVLGRIARIILDIDEDGGIRPGYKLKLNSYDVGVDFELADATTRLRFEHPEVKVVCLESAREGVFSAGANIFMLASSSHSHKVNFCKFTNETRNNIEEATACSGQYYLASLTGIASGGGYELPLACAEIHLIDDRKSSVSLPEVPYLGVLPGTGGLTRLVDKRKVRRDHADLFCTVAEGVKGQRAVDWKIVDAVHPSSTYREAVENRLKELAETLPDIKGAHPQGIDWPELSFEISPQEYRYSHVCLKVNEKARVAHVQLSGPSEKDLEESRDPESLTAKSYVIRFWRELQDALLQLRFNHDDIGLILFSSKGCGQNVLSIDENLASREDHWLAREVRLLQKRVLKMIDVTARSFYCLVEPGSCFAGTFLEIALASDRIYMLDHSEKDNFLMVGLAQEGFFSMGHGLSRLENRFYQDEEALRKILEQKDQKLSAEKAFSLGLLTEFFDEIDWEDEIRVQSEERVSLSPDALTGLEANLRFVGPESMETRIFGRLSAWQNWIFTRPNATGERGALTSYGKETNAKFDWRRT